MKYLSLLLLFVGCVHQITSGVIVGKHYHEAYDTDEEMVIGEGDSQIKIPYVVHHPERWELVISNEEGHSARFDVEQSSYAKVSRGDYWTREFGSVKKGVVEDAP